MWWKILERTRPYAFIFLIVAGLLLELPGYFPQNNAAIILPAVCLLIVLAGIWYGRKSLLIALLFGVLNAAVSLSSTTIVTYDVLSSTLIFCGIALLVGTIAGHVTVCQSRIDEQNRRLEQLSRENADINHQIDALKTSHETAKKKHNLLFSIIRHNIQNELSALLGYIDLSKTRILDPELQKYVEQEDRIALIIKSQIEFSSTYDQIGAKPPLWQHVGMILGPLRSSASEKNIDISVSLGELEVFTDPLFVNIFENLINNSIRHGVRVKHISISYLPYGRDIAIVYEDDGIGIHTEDKERIFERGSGKNTGLGLFLSREIISVTGLSMKEKGEYGKGARFEIFVPEGKFRVRT